MFSKWIFTLSISTKKFLWYSPFLSKILAWFQGFWKKISFTYFLYTTISEVQTIFVWTQSYRGARLRFHFQSQKDSAFTLDGNKTVLVKFLLGILISFNFSFSRCFFPCNFFHLRGLFVFLKWMSNHFIEMHTPISILRGVLFFLYPASFDWRLSTFKNGMIFCNDRNLRTTFFSFNSYSILTQTFVKSYWVLFSFNSTECFFLLPLSPQCLFFTRGFSRFHLIFSGEVSWQI